MTWEIEIFLFVLLLTTGIAALQVRSLLAAAVITSVYSFIAALLFVEMGAVDVGFTEAVVGAGLVGVFFITAIFETTRRSSD